MAESPHCNYYHFYRLFMLIHIIFSKTVMETEISMDVRRSHLYDYIPFILSDSKLPLPPLIKERSLFYADAFAN